MKIQGEGRTLPWGGFRERFLVSFLKIPSEEPRLRLLGDV